MKIKLSMLAFSAVLSVSGYANNQIDEFIDGGCLPKNAYHLLDKITDINCTKNADDAVVVVVGEKAGLMSKQGKWLAKPEYDYILGEFHQGLTVVKNTNGKYGFMDKTGKIVIPFKYVDAWNFTDKMGLAQVKLTKDSKWGFINPNDDMVIAPKYDFVYALISENLFTAYRDGKAGFMDKTGKEVIAFDYDEALPFIEGLAMVGKNGKFGFINPKGQMVIPLTYDFALNFEEGVAVIRKGKKYGLIDKTGKEVITPEYDDVMYAGEDTYLVEKEDKVGYITTSGKPLTKMIYDEAGTFSEGLAVVCTVGKCGYIDITGKEAIALKYDMVSNFSNGKARVILGEKEFVIDKTGQVAP